MMNKKILVSLIIILTLLITANLYSAAMMLFAKPVSTARIRLNISDISDNKPVRSACVYIAETGRYFDTDNAGYTPVIEVPIMPANHYDNIYKRSFGEITVIVYKEGYIDYALFNLNVRENEERLNLKIFMYKKGTSNQNFISIVETPDNNWIQNLIDKYRKQS